MKHNSKILLYGANGYSAKLILEKLIAKNVNPVLAGRNKDEISALAKKHQLAYRIFDLNDLENIKNNLEDINTILNCAGPFSKTAKPLIDACLQNKRNYLDITGEVEIFKYAWSKNTVAIQNEITIMPGIGFDVVPTDCMAKLLTDEMQDAEKIQLAIAIKNGKISRGTFKSSLENISESVFFRENGEMKNIPFGEKNLNINFVDFKSSATAIPWADAYNAYFSTGIKNIEIYLAIPEIISSNVKFFAKILSNEIFKNLLTKIIDAFIVGPDEVSRRKSLSYIWGRAVNKVGNEIEHVFVYPDGYEFTALAASVIAILILNGKGKAGTQTPALNFGNKFSEQFLIKKLK